MKRFWKIEYEKYASGYGGEEYTEKRLFWGTWFEAARECVKNDESIGAFKHRRKVELFELPNVKRKKKGFYVL